MQDDNRHTTVTTGLITHDCLYALIADINKTLIDRRLRPRCCHLGSYFKRPKGSPVRPLACSWLLPRTVYSQAQGCVCTALQQGGDVEQPWLMGKYDVIHKTVRFSPISCTLPTAVARSSSGGVVIRYVLPVLWMTSYLRIS